LAASTEAGSLRIAPATRAEPKRTITTQAGDSPPGRLRLLPASRGLARTGGTPAAPVLTVPVVPGVPGVPGVPAAPAPAGGGGGGAGSGGSEKSNPLPVAACTEAPPRIRTREVSLAEAV